MFKRENTGNHSNLIQNGWSSKYFFSFMFWASTTRNDDLSDSIIQEFKTMSWIIDIIVDFSTFKKELGTLEHGIRLIPTT